jgi:glycosyltransferase involved in cell wall biosynthesis
MQRSATLFLPIINWEFRRQRPQQLARCFARSGDRVYYPFLRLHPDPPPPDLVESGIWQIALRGDPALDPYRDRLSGRDVDEALASLRDLAEDHPLDGCWIVAQLPFWRPLAEAAREAFRGRLLFDCMDDFSSFGDHADSREEEVALARSADLVTVTAQALFDKLAPHNPRCRIVRNGCDPEHFGPAVARRRLNGRPVIGFFGGIHDWFDAPLVEELARLRPDWEVWLVGDTYRARVEALREMRNVNFFGEVPYSELPRLVSFFDVGIIPFRITPLTEATNPVKVYEMLAAGLPVVAVDLPELRPLQPLVSLASTAGELVQRIEEALAEPPEAREQRREFALRQSWVERFLELRRAMEETAGAVPRGAVGESGPPTLASLGIADPGAEKLALHRQIDALQAERNEGEAALRNARLQCAGLARTAADLEAQRISLIGQRDRVQAEAERLSGELTRIEAERLRFERTLQRLHASLWWRLGARLGLLRPDPET